MSRYPSSGSSSRRPAPSYQTSSSSRNYSSTSSSDRDYSRSHLSGSGSGHYFNTSATSRKPESGSTGYSYLEPNWIEKTRSSISVDPYSSSYLDRASAAATAQAVYPSAAAAALSVSGYNSTSMPKAYARADDYYRSGAATLAAPSAYGYSSAFEQSTMAAQAAAIYEMQNSKRDAWPSSAHVDYARRDEDRRGGMEKRKDERRTTDSWRDREREPARDRDRRPSAPSRDRDRDRDLRVTVSSSGTRRATDDHHREARRVEPVAARGGGGGRHERDRDVRDSRDASSRRPAEKRMTSSDSRLDRESRELERQLAKVQRELEQLESGGRGGGGAKTSNSREKESDRSRRSAPSSSSTSAVRHAPSPRARGKQPLPPSRRMLPPRAGVSVTSSAYHRTPAVRPSRPIRPMGRNGRPSAALPSLMDAVVPRPGRRPALATARVSRAWEAPVRRGAAPLPPRALATRRIAGYATKRAPMMARGGRGGGGELTMTSREKVRRAKEKMRRDEERKRRVEKKKEERNKENREKRKEEDFAWLETIMSEDEEMDEETNRKLLLAPRQRQVIAIVDKTTVHPHTLENLDVKRETDEAKDEDQIMWTMEEIDAIELLPIVDSVVSLTSDVVAAFLEAHPEPAPQKTDAIPDSNGNGKMEE